MLYLRLRYGRFGVGVAGLIRDEGGRILLVHRTYSRDEPWALPGGWLEGNEAIERALERELHEETGLRVKVGAVRAVERAGFAIVLLMSDGLDTLSSTKYAEVVAAARDRGVSFYVIHFQLFTPGGGRLVPRPPSKGFRELAEQTGGRYFRIGDAKSALDPHAQYDLAPVFEAIDNDLRGQYVLGFYPRETSRDGQPHQVAIGLANRKSKLRVHQVKTTYRLSK